MCDEKGHLSYDCPNEFQDGVDNENHHRDEPPVEEEVNPDLSSKKKTDTSIPKPSTTEAAEVADITEETGGPEDTNDNTEIEMQEQRSRTKRHHPSTDTDSEPQPQHVTRRSRMKPTPNLIQARPQQRDKDKDKNN